MNEDIKMNKLGNIFINIIAILLSIIIISGVITIIIGIPYEIYKQYCDDKSFKMYVENAKYITEPVDKVLYNTNSSEDNSQRYTALVNASPVDYDNVAIKNDISKPYIKYKTISASILEKYNQWNKQNKSVLIYDATLYIPKDYFK